MKTLNLFFIFISMLFLFQSCKKEPVHPEVKTTAVQALSPVRIKITGEIINKGSFEVLDYGFIYGTGSSIGNQSETGPFSGELYGTKVSLGREAPTGTISSEVSVSISNNYSRTIYARTYLTNEKGTVFGTVMSVTLGSVTMGSISPTSGKAGDQVNISGNFSTLGKDDIKVTFGGINAGIVSVSPNKVVVTVPTGIVSQNSSNEVPVAVLVAGQSIGYSYNIFKLVPNVTGYSPQQGPIGTRITFTADNVPSYVYYYDNYKVYLGQTQVTPTISNRILSVVVPEHITTEKFTVSFEANGIKTTLPGEFTLTPPSITSITSSSGLPGTSFTIYGNHLPVNSYNAISIGTRTISSHYSSVNNQLSASIPSDMTPGEYDVSVKHGPFTIKAAQKLVVKNPTIASFSPSSGAPGREITLHGEFTPGHYYAVFFGSISTTSNNASANTLKVWVPAGLNAGNVKISIKQGTQTITAAGDFTVLAPEITSFSPTSGVAGTIVTINGVGFTPSVYYGSNQVRFGTILTPTLISATETTLKVVVPSNLNPGAMKITVTNGNGQTVSSSGNFTVTN